MEVTIKSIVETNAEMTTVMQKKKNIIYMLVTCIYYYVDFFLYSWKTRHERT